jgi:hypothetical protein
MGEWKYISTILDLGTRWWVVSFTHRPLYSRGKWPKYPLDRRLDGPRSWSGYYGEKKNILPPSGIEPWPSTVSIPTALSFKIRFTPLCTLGIIMEQYDWKSQLPGKFRYNFLSNFAKIYETVYGIYGKPHSWFSVTWALLQINMAVNGNCPLEYDAARSRWKSTDVSEEQGASTFRVEE